MYLDLNSACQIFYSCFKVSKGRYNVLDGQMTRQDVVT